MGKNIDYILIENSVKKALKDIQDNPKRTIRNLVDYGLEFAKGGFQKQSLQLAQQLLADENCRYYELIRNAVDHVDSKTLLSFGMNVGYNACTMGVKRIRLLEAREQMHIPWCLFLKVKDFDEEHQKQFCRILEEGMELGIYVFVFVVEGQIEPLLGMLSEYKQCAFVLMCRKDCLCDEVLDQVAELHNLMLSVGYEKDIDTTVAEMRKRGLLYGLHAVYGRQELADIESGQFFQSLEPLWPLSVALLADSDVEEKEKARLDQALCTLRITKSYPTFILHLQEDIQRIDEVFSNEGYCVGIDEQGFLMLNRKSIYQADANAFQRTLKTVLRHCLAKQGNYADKEGD